MLTNLQVLIYAAAIVILLPLVLWSLATGSAVPEGSWFTKYYGAERYLTLAGNLFLLALIAVAVAKLAAHFGYVDPAMAADLDTYTGIAFGVTLVIFLALWVRAVLKVRRSSTPPCP